MGHCINSLLLHNNSKLANNNKSRSNNSIPVSNEAEDGDDDGDLNILFPKFSLIFTSTSNMQQKQEQAPPISASFVIPITMKQLQMG